MNSAIILNRVEIARKKASLCSMQTEQMRALAVDVASRAPDSDVYFLTRFLEGETEGLSFEEKADFCRFFTDARKKYDVSDFLEMYEPAECDAPENVSRPKNATAEAALRALSDVKAFPTLSESYQASCEDVYFGRCGGCVVPYIGADGAKLASFALLASKYLLCVCALAKAPDKTVFALLRRGFVRTEGECFLDLSLTPGGDIAEFIPGLRRIAGGISGISSYRDGSYFLRVKTDSEDIPAVLFFLGISCVSYTCTGLYKKF